MIWRMEVVNKMSLPLIDLATEIAAWAAAKYGRQVRSATVSALTKVQNQMNAAIEYVTNLGTDTEIIQQSAIQAAAQAAAAAENANQALENVEEVRQDLADRVASGEFDGAPGEQGPPGPQGESGVGQIDPLQPLLQLAAAGLVVGDVDLYPAHAPHPLQQHVNHPSLSLYVQMNLSCLSSYHFLFRLSQKFCALAKFPANFLQASLPVGAGFSAASS